jgi:hypothetical protein
MPRRELRFATRFRGLYAEPWIVKGWGRDQFVVARDGSDGLHVTRHQTGFVGVCGIDARGVKYDLPDPASLDARPGSVIVVNIVRPPAVCVLTTPPTGDIVYDDSPAVDHHVIQRVVYQPSGRHDPLPALCDGAKLTGVLDLSSGGAVTVVSQLLVSRGGKATITGPIFTPATRTTPVGAVIYRSADGLVVYEFVNVDALPEHPNASKFDPDL